MYCSIKVLWASSFLGLGDGLSRSERGNTWTGWGMSYVSAKLLQGSLSPSTAKWWVISRCIYSKCKCICVQFCRRFACHTFIHADFSVSVSTTFSAGFHSDEFANHSASDFIGLETFPQVQSSFMVHSKSCVCTSTHRGVASQICHNAKIISLLRGLEKN